MKVTALLCDYAQVTSDHKLTIVGANITRLATAAAEPPLPMSFALAVIVEVPWDRTNSPHQMTIELIHEPGEGMAQRIPLPGTDPAGEGAISVMFNVGRGPDLVPGESSLVPVALPFAGLPLPAPGGYSFAVQVDGDELAHVPFQVRVLVPGFRAA